MAFGRKPSFAKFMAGASVVAMGLGATQAMAQDANADGETVQEVASEDNVIVVTGIRASLRESMNIKRDAQGVVDAISAEDIGKFPDTNLAESLQRITGVSIDRQSGEGSKVTVRGFGPDFNLVLLNGRQMPASGLGSCCEAPASRSFDFANLASEGIAAVEVYKSGRATLPTGGIGSVINIRTPKPLDRPGFQGSVGAKAVLDHTFDDTKVTPEISGIVSQTFGDNTVGILLSGSYQKREGSLAQFNAGWREGYLGFENNWGSLPVDANDWRGNYDRTENRPGENDVYQVTQNAGYDFTNFERERINGQAVLQWAPSDQFQASLDYTYSRYTLDAQTNSIGVWFNHDQTSSSWTDGPAAGPNFYAESFGPGKDLAITGAVAANRNENKSLGGTLNWDHPDGWRFELDAHHSTAESLPTSPYGSNIAVGSAIFGVQNQRVDFTSDMPVISVSMYPGSEIQASNIRPAGNAFRTAYMKDRINEVRFAGGKDFDDGFIESLDFGVTYTDNKVRSAYGFLQTDSWGGTDVNPDPFVIDFFDVADDFYTARALAPDLAGMDGSQASDIIPTYFRVDTPGLIATLDQNLGICTTPWVGRPTGEGCLAEFDVDRLIREKTVAPYVQSLHTFNFGADEAHLRLGLRYEVTDLISTALTPIYTGTVQTAENEISLLRLADKDYLTVKNSYDNWLPAVDLDFSPIQDVVVRASYSHTITRPNYAQIEAGFTLDSPARRGGGSTGGAGNPSLNPYKSKNIDVSAEWYYAPTSYLSVGYFNKRVTDFIGNRVRQDSAFDLRDPSAGVIYQAALAALGADATFSQVLAYAAQRFPEAVTLDGNGAPLGLIGQPNDPQLLFNLRSPINIDGTAKIDGWEFAITHAFWDTGFGAILNYTIVNSDTEYDLLRPGFDPEPQFAVTGVSDSANAVLYFDKYGFQARVAYNWRDEFLGGYGNDPFIIEEYGQFDVSASYDFGNGLSVFAEGINITNADRKGHMRADQAVFFAAPGYARYAGGVRFTW